MEHKDRLGDKLHDKEKGEENRFAAEHERKAIEKLRAKMAAAPKGLCPRCGATLVAKNVMEGVGVLACEDCRGLWLDQGDLRTLAAQGRQEAAITRWLRGFLPH